MPPEDYSRLDFGRLEAESDKDLPSYFLATRHVQDIVGRGKYLVLGRKGAGKTALFKYLESRIEESRPDVEVISLDLIDYAFEIHRNLNQEELTPARSYSLSWKLLYYYIAAEKIFNSLERTEQKTLVAAFNQIGITSGVGSFGALGNWFRRSRDPKTLTLPTVAGVGGGGITVADGPRAVDPQMSGSLSKIEEIFSQNFSRAPFTVLVDRLDDAWDGSDQSKKLIAGAINAARDLSISLSIKGYPAPVVAFLRTDIWNALSFNDLNKTSQDQVHLDWSDNELQDIVALRISHSLDCSKSAAWAKAFPIEEMRNRQSAFKYMTKRTMRRPRDLIAFCINAEESRADIMQSISPSDIYEGEGPYSDHMLRELKDEIGLHEIEFDEVVRALKGLGKRSHTESEWLQSCSRNRISEGDAHKVLDLLFDCSVIGVFKSGSTVKFRYDDPYLARPSEGLQVHPSLLKALNLTDR